METTLQEINSVIGVNGSFACLADGKIIASAMPASFEKPRLELLARVATQSLNALEISRQHVTDVDLIFDQHRIVIKNLRGGVLAIFCGRNVNLPLLNMTANNAVKKLAAALSARSGVIPAAMVNPPPAPPPTTIETPPPTPTPSVPAPESTRVVEVTPNELYMELEKESQRLISAANSAQLRLCVIDSIALWARTSYARARVTQPQKRQLDFLASSDQALLVSRVFDRVGYRANQKFNSANATRLLNFNETTREISVMVFLNAYEMYHRIDFLNVLAQNESIMTETGLTLIRLQNVDITIQGLDELCALFLEHELSAGFEKDKIDAAQITRLCADDWGWYRTVTMNLDRLQAFAARELSPTEETRVVDRIRRLRQSMDSAPKSIRWQTRARLGDGVRWYETPQALRPAASRPDLAIGA